MGAGTTAVVSIQNRRNYVGIELNPEYIQIAEKRLQPIQEKQNQLEHNKEVLNRFFE
jgi:DNA modification methylase